MGEMLVPSKARESSIEIVVIRADGTVENHGVVAYWHKNPLRRWWWKFRRMLTHGR